MAFGLGVLERPAHPLTDILWLLRSDKESVNTEIELAESHIERRDWIKPGTVDQEYVDGARRYQNCISELFAQLSEKALCYCDISDKIAELYRKLACLRVQRGLNMLSSSQVVITDRLHGHILCRLMGIPHVVLDNNYKKISNMLSSWASSPITIQAQSLEQAVLAARQLVNMINEKHERSTT